ncbi:sulfite exporter TauE/SafE family protein [Saccharomonospora xinjiangensis]|uniref:Probable membrane transporter protein n=1 Tax=Saccharomonospora xinjiangensis XJ-54 TaxID=882086 RepID=I0V7I1_9PSEU|nr:sulfite exporter TauE/SafE family protein [Saccharomonospora xinjiangensis]EID56084.1 putative permease [Saccharomonospora xinjiangensis XJ-54]
MRTLVLFGVAGMLAQLVDGSLGMAFGVTATTTLVTVGTAPAVASAAVHLAEVGTSLASGAAHWRFRNIDWPTVGMLAVPGAVGAVLGAYVLTSLPTGLAEVWITVVLLSLGAYVLVRFSFLRLGTFVATRRPGARFLAPLGVVAGFVDASGGGGWGPVATTTLLSSGRLEPRKVVGSVDTSEFVVALAASIGFLVTLPGQECLNYTVVLGLMIGGVLAAPVAAWLVRLLPPRVLGSAAGGLIVFTNARSLLRATDASTGVTTAALAAVVVLWAAGLASAIRSVRQERRTGGTTATQGGGATATATVLGADTSARERKPVR